jgi:thiamine pyrophosphate-dependent acetolactate synthase large subunit-like protein
MLKTATKTEARDAQQELTDGFHLIIDALKLNGLNTIYGVPGIPVTDFGRMAQAEGIRLISFRHEQNAGNAAAIAGFLTKKPGVCLTVSAPGFLNGLTVFANATTNCPPMILISGSSEREIDLQQGDYEEMDQLAIAKPLGKGAVYAQADDHIRALNEKNGIPFLPMSMAKGLMPDTHPQSTTPRQGPRQTLPSLPLCLLQEQIRYGARR